MKILSLLGVMRLILSKNKLRNSVLHMIHKLFEVTPIKMGGSILFNNPNYHKESHLATEEKGLLSVWFTLII